MDLDVARAICTRFIVCEAVGKIGRVSKSPNDFLFGVVAFYTLSKSASRESFIISAHRVMKILQNLSKKINAIRRFVAFVENDCNDDKEKLVNEEK